MQKGARIPPPVSRFYKAMTGVEDVTQHTNSTMRLLVQVCAVLACVAARPSDSVEDVRESRTGPGFKSPEGYTDTQANAEHRIPVQVLFADNAQVEQHSSTVSPTTTQENSKKSSEQPQVTQQTPEATTTQEKIGDSDERVGREQYSRDFDATVRHEPVSTISNPNARSVHIRVKSPVKIYKSESNDDTKPIRVYKSEDNTDTKEIKVFKSVDDSEIKTEKINKKYVDDNVDSTKTVHEETQSAEPQPVLRQYSPFENPILTYLTRQQQQPDNNNLEVENKQRQNIRREIFHQQTIINPNPYMQQFLQGNPSFLPSQSAFKTGTQYFSYQQPSNIMQNFQGQSFPNSQETNREEFQQAAQGTPSNYVTSLTLYPAIASVMYTHPTTGYQPSQQYPTQSNQFSQPAYPVSSQPTPASNPPFAQSNPQFPQSSSPVLQQNHQFSQSTVIAPTTPPLQTNPQLISNYPNTRLFYNGVQPTSRISWPLSGYFPIVIKDPFLSMFNAFTNMVEYGPEADVCKKSKSYRQGRSKDQILNKYESEDEEEEQEEDRKKKDDSAEIVMESGGNGNAGPYITRLMVRKGGVSIAGPGGIATAGSGGTAIVGPGGVAYTSPNGLAVVGPGGKVIGLPSGTDLSAITSQLTNPATPNSEGSTPRFINIPPGGRVVATGPIVYYHPPE